MQQPEIKATHPCIMTSARTDAGESCLCRAWACDKLSDSVTAVDSWSRPPVSMCRRVSVGVDVPSVCGPLGDEDARYLSKDPIYASDTIS